MVSKSMYWTSEWDGTPNKSMKIHQLVKNGVIVAYIKQQPGDKFGNEYAYIRGNFRPVFASKIASMAAIKKSLENWAKGTGRVTEIRD